MSESVPFKSSASPPPQKKPPTVTELIAALPGKIFRRDALLLVVVAGLGAAGAVYGQGKLDDIKTGVARQVDAGVAPLETKLDEHIKTEAEARARLERSMERLTDAMQAKEERDARRFDALQNTILERRAQPESAELARPAPVKDGGR